MPDVDTELAAALRQNKTTPMFFALAAKGANDGALMVGRQKIPAKEVADAKARTKATTVYTGRCVFENGTTFFEMKGEPPSTLAKQIRTIALRDAGVTLKVETRRAHDLDDDEGEAHPATTTTATTTDHATAELEKSFVARLKGVMPIYQKVNALPDVSNISEIRDLFGEVDAQARDRDFASASAGLDKLEPLLKGALTEAVSGKKKPEADKEKADEAGPTLGLVALQKLRLAWTAAVDRARAEMSKLLAAIPDGHADDPRLPAIEKVFHKLDAELEVREQHLADKLDQALNAEPAERAKFHKEAAAIAEKFRAHVDGDPILKQLDANGLVAVSVTKTLSDTLKILATKLKG